MADKFGYRSFITWLIRVLVSKLVTVLLLQVDEIIMHPRYLQDGRPSADFDIALLKLARPVQPTSHVGFICLPESNTNEPAPGTLCTVTGWGHKVFRARVSPDILHSAQVPVVSRR